MPLPRPTHVVKVAFPRPPIRKLFLVICSKHSIFVVFAICSGSVASRNIYILCSIDAIEHSGVPCSRSIESLKGVSTDFKQRSIFSSQVEFVVTKSFTSISSHQAVYVHQTIAVDVQGTTIMSIYNLGTAIGRIEFITDIELGITWLRPGPIN